VSYLTPLSVTHIKTAKKGLINKLCTGKYVEGSGISARVGETE
jgi:hypothetical protein